MRKQLIYYILLVLFSGKSYAQCNCSTSNFNGNDILQCVPTLVAYDTNFQVALSLSKTPDEFFLLATVRFQNGANTISSDLMVFTTSEKVLTIELIDSKKDYIGGSEICNAKFKLTEEDLSILSKFEISTLRFTFSREDIARTFGIKKNKDVIIQQVQCLTSK